MIDDLTCSLTFVYADKRYISRFERVHVHIIYFLAVHSLFASINSKNCYTPKKRKKKKELSPFEWMPIISMDFHKQ